MFESRWCNRFSKTTPGALIAVLQSKLGGDGIVRPYTTSARRSRRSQWNKRLEVETFSETLCQLRLVEHFAL